MTKNDREQLKAEAVLELSAAIPDRDAHCVKVEKSSTRWSRWLMYFGRVP